MKENEPIVIRHLVMDDGPESDAAKRLLEEGHYSFIPVHVIKHKIHLEWGYTPPILIAPEGLFGGLESIVEFTNVPEEEWAKMRKSANKYGESMFGKNRLKPNYPPYKNNNP